MKTWTWQAIRAGEVASVGSLVGLLNKRMADLTQSLKRSLTYTDAAELTADTSLDFSYAGLRLRADTTSNAVTLTLPPHAQSVGLMFWVKWYAGANTLTVAAAGSDTIDGASTQVFSVAKAAYGFFAGPDEWEVW